MEIIEVKAPEEIGFRDENDNILETLECWGC